MEPVPVLQKLNSEQEQLLQVLRILCPLRARLEQLSGTVISKGAAVGLRPFALFMCACWSPPSGRPSRVGW